MPNFALLLKEEIRRLARKEIKSSTDPLKKEIVRLRKTVRELRERIQSAERSGSGAPRRKQAVASDTSESDKRWVRKSRMTAQTIRELRERLRLSQAGLAKLLGVSMLAVYQWEHSEGTLNLRSKRREALLSVRGMGLREAQRKLEEISGAAGKPKRGRPKKSV